MHTTYQHPILHTDSNLLRPVEQLAEGQCVGKLELIHHLESVK